MKKYLLTILIVCIVFSQFEFTGCTLIGLGLGAAMDATTPDFDSYIPPEYKTLDSGEEYIFVLQDGDSIIANYIGINKNVSNEYINTTSNFNNIGLPQYGTPLILTTNAGHQLKGKFLGIDDPSLLVMQLYDRPHPRKVILDSLKSMVDITRNEYNIHEIKQIIRNDDILPFSHLLVEHNGQKQSVSPRKVTEIKQDNSHNRWIYGLAGGLIIDIIFLLNFEPNIRIGGDVM